MANSGFFSDMFGGTFPGSSMSIPKNLFKIKDGGVVDTLANTFVSNFDKSYKNKTGIGGYTNPQAGRAFLQDSKFAYFLHNAEGSHMDGNWPLVDFQYFVRFNFNERYMENFQNYLTTDDLGFIQFLVKNVELPSVRIATETLNQYNKKVLSQTKVDFDELNLTFFDVADGKTQKMWEAYYNYYFRDGLADKFKNNSAGNKGSELDYSPNNQNIFLKDTNPTNLYGYNLDSVLNDRYLIESIDVFQFTGLGYKVIHFIHPRITSFKQSALSYSSSAGLTELSFGFQCENVVYQNKGISFAEDDELTAQAYQLMEYGRVFDIPALVAKKSPRAYDQSSYVQYGTGNAAKDFTLSRGGLTDSLLGSVGGMFGINTDAIKKTPILGSIATSLDKRVTSVVNGLPRQVANSVLNGVLTGNFKMKPNVKDALKNAVNQEKMHVQHNLESALHGTVVKGVQIAAGGASPVIESAVDKTSAAVRDAAGAIKTSVGSVFGGNNQGGIDRKKK